MQQVSEFLTQASTKLNQISDTPDLDAQVLLADVMNQPRTWLVAHPETLLTKPQLATLNKAIARLEAGEPLPYVLGHWEFFGLQFDITPDVLIPRPETELVIEHAIQWLNSAPDRRNIADVGTGSGCIAVTLAKNIADANIFATDISREALDVAQQNACRYNLVEQINFLQCDLLPKKSDALFDLICANLPYIPTQTLRGLDVHNREPTTALDGGKDGLDFIRRLLDITPKWIAPNGMMLLEIDSSQGSSAISLANSAFADANIHLHQDLAGKDRLVEIRV